MSNYTHKPGDVLNFGGVVSAVEGIVDYTGYTLKCQFRNPKTGALLADAVITWQGSVVTPTPAMLIHVDGADTAEWPENSTVRFDIVIFDPTGEPMTTQSNEFNTARRDTALS